MILTPIRAPNATAYAERVIETIRAECLDWTLILGRRLSTGRFGPTPSTTTAGGLIVLSPSRRRWSKPGTRCR